MNKIILGIIWGVTAQILTFIQLQGSFKFEILKNNVWAVVLFGIPVTYMYIQSVKNFIEAYNGEIWPSRLIGFGIGVTIFTLMSYWWFKEPITFKTAVCLMLGIFIIVIQILWK